MTSLAKKLLLCFCFCTGFITAKAQAHLDSWKIADGMPQNTVLSLARTPDGYLWIGTFEGLARFDGVDFTVFNTVNTPEIESNYISALLADRQGNLWIGTDGGGLTKRAGDGSVHFSTADGLLGNNITCLLEDRAGNIWAATRNDGLNRFRDGRIDGFTTADGLPDNNIQALAEDAGGAIWVGTSGGLARFDDGKFMAFRADDGLADDSVSALWQSRAGDLWIGTAKGLNLWRGGRIERAAQAGEIGEQAVESLAEDANGNLWVGMARKNLYRIPRNGGKAEKMFGDFFNDKVRILYPDSENSLWIGAFSNGLSHLQAERFYGLTIAEGFPEDSFWMVFEDRSGGLWFSNFNNVYRQDGALYRHKNGKTETFTPPADLQTVVAVTEDANGNLWFGGRGGIARFADGNFTPLTTKNGFPASGASELMGDRAGNLWVGTPDKGLCRFRDGRFTVYDKALGLADNAVTTLIEDAGGAIWIGTTRGLSRLQDERISSWTLGEGAASNWINSFYEDAGGALWIGTSGGGLYRFKDDKFTRITSREGLFDDLAFAILESGGDLWMSGNKGVYRANLQELNDFADGRRASINSYPYDAADGMPNRECNGGSPAGWKTRDGFLWFVTPNGLTRAAPQMTNAKPPAVLIERVRLGDETRSISQRLDIAPGEENLEIKYTAIDWQRPKHIKFKYRLDGLDAHWTEAGTRRTAYYPYLPPGEYTFQVIADNGEGVWNESGKSLRIKVLPPFYRTWWFFALAIFALACVVFWLYQRRVSALERRRAAQEEFSRRLINAHETERHRIAAELHDSIGQSLAMIKNSAVFGAQTLNDLNEAKEQLAEISTQSAQAISEVREIAYNLRPFMLDRLGLTKAVVALLEKIEDNSALEIEAQIEDIDGIFEPEAEIGIYRIIQESLNNILKHAEAKNVSVSIVKTERAVLIKIEDDGKGFDVKAKRETKGRGGFGLLGMSERVRMLGGTIAFESVVSKGTTITIELWKHK